MFETLSSISGPTGSSLDTSKKQGILFALDPHSFITMIRFELIQPKTNREKIEKTHEDRKAEN